MVYVFCHPWTVYQWNEYLGIQLAWESITFLNTVYYGIMLRYLGRYFVFRR